MVLEEERPGEGSMIDPIPARPPIGGFVWTVIVPAALLAVSFLATWMLYRHFARKPPGR